jgi:sarcosine oxidase
MIKKFDTIIVGLGATGSAAIYQLAKRGNKAFGLEEFSRPHNNGSSHGESRIIRQAIGESEEYVPFALRSYELWREIEREKRQGTSDSPGERAHHHRLTVFRARIQTFGVDR